LHAISHDPGKIFDSSVCIEMECRLASLRNSTIIPRIMSFTSTNSRCEISFLKCERIQLMISALLNSSTLFRRSQLGKRVQPYKKCARIAVPTVPYRRDSSASRTARLAGSPTTNCSRVERANVAVFGPMIATPSPYGRPQKPDYLILLPDLTGFSSRLSLP
jgi:hypothetical protein